MSGPKSRLPVIVVMWRWFKTSFYGELASCTLIVIKGELDRLGLLLRLLDGLGSDVFLCTGRLRGIILIFVANNLGDFSLLDSIAISELLLNTMFAVSRQSTWGLRLAIAFQLASDIAVGLLTCVVAFQTSLVVGFGDQFARFVDKGGPIIVVWVLGLFGTSERHLVAVWISIIAVACVLCA